MSLLSCLTDEPGQPFVGDEHTAYAKRDTAYHILVGIHQLVHAHMLPTIDFAVGRQRLCRAFPGSARPKEEADLNPFFRAEPHHPANLVSSEQHHTAAL